MQGLLPFVITRITVINIIPMMLHVPCDFTIRKMSRQSLVSVESEVLKLSNLSRKHERYVEKLKSKVTRYVERSRKGTLMRGVKPDDRETTKK